MKIQDPHSVLGRGLKRKHSDGSDTLLENSVVTDDILDSICSSLTKACKIDPDAVSYPALNINADVYSSQTWENMLGEL